MLKPTITQVYSFIGEAEKIGHLKYDWTNAYNILKDISTSQYRRLLHLLYSHKILELQQMLDQINLPKLSADLSAE